MVPTPPPLKAIPATAFVPLWARALETQSPEPLFLDPHAVEAVQTLDFDFGAFETMNIMARETTVAGTAVRTAQVDAVVRTFIAEHPHGRVVNMGCGLDGRSHRLDDGSTEWLDVDLPEMIALRKTLFDQTRRRRMMAMSMFDDDFVAEISSTDDQPLLILSEGVLLYFSAAEVTGLLTHLARSIPRATLVFDVVGTSLCDEHHPGVLAIGEDVPVGWGIDDHESLAHLHPSLTFLGFESAYDSFPQRWRALSHVLPALRERVGQGVVTMGIGITG